MKSKKYIARPGLIPAGFLFVLWPAIVHMDHVQTGLSDQPWYPDVSVQGDFFMHIRSILLLVLAVWMIFILVDRILIQRQAVFFPRSFLLLLIFGVLAVASTIFSVNKNFSLSGVAEQYETLWVLLAYLVVFLYFYMVIDHTVSVDWILTMLLGGLFLQELIGLSQLAGCDFWSSAPGKQLILLGTNAAQSLDFSFAEESRVYLSFYNPNYAAVYLVLMLPFGVFAIHYFQKKWQKILSGFVAVLLLVCLWGTGSKAGLITVFVMGSAAIVFIQNSGKQRVLVLAGGATCIVVYLIVSFWLPGTSTAERIWKNLFPEQKHYRLEEVKLSDDRVQIRFDGKEYNLNVKEEDDQFWFYITDSGGQTCELEHKEVEERQSVDSESNAVITSGRFVLKHPQYKKLEFEVFRQDGTIWMIMYRVDIPWRFRRAEDGSWEYITAYGKADTPVNAPYAFGKGYEMALTGRIYLWSRTVPLLKKYPLLGSGPNTYSLIFPQNDYVARANMGEKMLNDIISRPHSYYLQTAVQTGIPSLVLLILFFGNYLRLVWSQGRKTKEQRGEAGSVTGKSNMRHLNNDAALDWQMCLSLSVLGFLMMGITNDSIVTTSPLFWAVLGMGCAVCQTKGRPQVQKNAKK